MRFSKENLKDHLINTLLNLEKDWNFDPQNGFDQVKTSHFHRIIAYGYYQALNDLYDDVEYNNIRENQ
jgi:hypothetical protein